MRRDDVRAAFFYAWLLLSVPVALALISSRVLPSEVLDRLVPTCELRRTEGRRCVACGLTTSFVHVARGELAEARAAHPWGPSLFACGVGDVAIALAWLPRLVRRRRVIARAT